MKKKSPAPSGKEEKTEPKRPAPDPSKTEDAFKKVWAARHKK